MEQISLSDPEWPDLTDLFSFEPLTTGLSLPQLGGGGGGSGAATLNPAIYQRPSLTLTARNQGMGGPNQMLTPNRMALLSPEEQLYYMRRNQRNLIT